jgi:hypothetical protein
LRRRRSLVLLRLRRSLLSEGKVRAHTDQQFAHGETQILWPVQLAPWILRFVHSARGGSRDVRVITDQRCLLLQGLDPGFFTASITTQMLFRLKSCGALPHNALVAGPLFSGLLVFVQDLTLGLMRELRQDVFETVEISTDAEPDHFLRLPQLNLLLEMVFAIPKNLLEGKCAGWLTLSHGLAILCESRGRLRIRLI